MKKQFNASKGYLLGIDQDGNKVYLQKPSWDCDWYWGFGYVQSYRPHTSSMEGHTHFDSLFLTKDLHNSYLNYFTDLTLDKNEIWTLLELMKTFYTLREYSDTINRGGSHITSNPLKDLIKNDEQYNHINKVVLPELYKEIHKLLTE